MTCCEERDGATPAGVHTGAHVDACSAPEAGQVGPSARADGQQSIMLTRAA